MVQTGMTAPYAAQFAQNGEAGGPLKAAEAGKEAPVVPGPPFSPPAAVPLNGIEQQTVSIVSILGVYLLTLFCVQVWVP